MASSEAVMVAPEQCATAPKTLVSKQAAAPAAAKTSTTRVVLLAVLALAAATGAMFGVVVFGNEFTKDMHPKGGALVDSEDRAVATAAVESYVSLLDLPLLGTAELNKVDGITFSTYKGIEHRKVTGYTVTKETAVVGDSEVATPRLSLATSAPGVTVEVSVRDNKAWLSEAAAGKVATTAIDATSQRRLADGGSCLENGACLYSRDELLHLDAASRRLEEGSFFARADVAAYQVELDGDVMPYLERSAEGSAHLDGTWVEGGHRLRLRVAETPAGTEAFFTNYTSGKSKLLTKAGAYLYTADGRLYQCHEATMAGAIADYTVDSLVDSMTFEAVEVSHGEAQADFIPFRPADRECLSLLSKRGNLSSPEALEAFPKLAGAYQNQAALGKTKGSYLAGRNRRRMTKQMRMHQKLDKRFSPAAEMKNLMTKKARRELGGGLTSFDLWVATRMADPTFIDYKGYVTGSSTDSDFSDASPLKTDVALSLGGLYGISLEFKAWSGFSYYGARRRLKGKPMPFEDPRFMPVEHEKFAREEKREEKFPEPMFAIKLEEGPMDEKEKDMYYEKMHEFYAIDTFSSYITKVDKSVIEAEEFDIYDVDCGSKTSLDSCMAYAFAECEWNPIYGCCSDAGLPCGGGASVELDVGIALGVSSSITSVYKTNVDKTVDFLTEVHVGSCPGGFLPTNPMMDPIKIASVCKEIDGGDFGGMCAGTDSTTFGKMTTPNAWASLLVKSGVKVVSFQGTKMHDASMMEYNLKRAPFYLEFGGAGTVIQEGYAMYLAALFPCIYQMPVGDYITGHSLGGAAATTYHQILGSVGVGYSGTVVTFGAPPTTLAGLYSSNVETPMPASGFEIKTKLPVQPQAATAFSCTEGGKSIRYFHKFDPIPSFYFAEGIWAHAADQSILLWDEIETNCASVPSSCGGSNPGVDNAIAPLKLSSYLCTKSGIKTSASAMGCSGMQYYSYTNILNPVPCAEVILSYSVSFWPSGTYDVIPWTPTESFEMCMESYIGTISAYFGLYITSDLESLRGDASERDPLEVAVFYAAWGIMWIHSSYANYGLCETSYGSELVAGSNALATFDTYAKDVFSADWEYTGTPGSGDYQGSLVYEYSETYLQKLITAIDEA